MSQVAAMLRHVSDVRERLRNPDNAVIDRPINLKRREVVPIQQLDVEQRVPVNTWDVFGPKLPTVDDVAFGPLVHPTEPDYRPPATVAEIQRTVARHYNITRMELLAERRTAAIVLPRQIAMYLAKTLTLRSLPEVGRLFGNRDHTTVLHAVRKIERMRAEDPAFDSLIKDFEAVLVASPSQTEDAPCNSLSKP